MDAALLLAAGFIAYRSGDTLSLPEIFAIVGCVFAGMIMGTIPFLVHYEREKNAVLDARQQELEALSQTLAASAEQISIAATGLHQVAELAQKNLRHAEQLPHRLQDKMAEFQALLANASDGEKEELEKELTALRTSETERLESVSDKIAKAAADLTRLESSTQKNLAAAQDAAAKISAQAVEAVAKVSASLDEKLRSALAQIEVRLAALPAAPKNSAPSPTVAPEPDPVVESPPSPSASTEKPEGSAHPPKSPRKLRRDETVPPLAGNTIPPIVAANPEAHIEELPPVKPQQILPVAPGTHSPYVKPPVLPSGRGAALPDTAPPVTAEPKVVRKRSARKSSDDSADIAVHEPELALGDAPATAGASSAPADSEFSQSSPDEAAPVASIAADGATRIIVTAYIGIGNRLFIRGAGPGLSWEKGVPLQFVSIGKWRWETSDATAPVKFKLYKNDELECAALGAQSLAPGNQQELTAAF